MSQVPVLQGLAAFSRFLIIPLPSNCPQEGSNVPPPFPCSRPLRPGPSLLAGCPHRASGSTGQASAKRCAPARPMPSGKCPGASLNTIHTAATGCRKSLPRRPQVSPHYKKRHQGGGTQRRKLSRAKAREKARFSGFSGSNWLGNRAHRLSGRKCRRYKGLRCSHCRVS